MKERAHRTWAKVLNALQSPSPWKGKSFESLARFVPRSTLYRNLPKLEGKGYIRKDQDGKYLITEKGIEFHRELLSDVEASEKVAESVKVLRRGNTFGNLKSEIKAPYGATGVEVVASSDVLYSEDDVEIANAIAGYTDDHLVRFTKDVLLKGPEVEEITVEFKIRKDTKRKDAEKSPA